MNGKAPGIGIDEIYFAALEHEGPETRAAYLDEACGPDPELRRRVERLLDAQAERGSFLESPAPVPTVDIGARLAEGPGTVIGPYKLLEIIGEGGMGTVYMAEQTEPVRRRVALKVIKPGMDTKQVVARFEAERQALAMMDHPNIAKVHDGGATGSGRPYFVMELVRGLPVTEYCDKEQLSIPERLELFVLVCRAVQHAHQKGIIHRDLKPSNVLVTVIDGVAVPKVIDFGVAKATGQALTERTLFTGFHQFVGTPLYVSPEQAELSGVDVDTRSDVYSLGVLLYELLTGTTPFDSETLSRAAFDEMRRIIREEEPQRPSTRLSSLGERLLTVSARRKSDPKRLGSSLKGELDWVVMKALEKDRGRRYETANDFSADVMRYLADRPVEAHPPTSWYRFSKFARRNRAALSTAALVLAALVLGLGLSTWQAVEATKARRETSSALTTAEGRLHLARQAADDMYSKVAEKWLAEQPSLTVLQQEFLEKALALYQTLVSEGAADPQVRHGAATALQRVGVIRRRLGRYADAEAALRKAVDQGRELVGQVPDQPEFLLELARSRHELAAVFRSTGRRAEAEAELRRAVDEMTKLTRTYPGVAAYRQLSADVRSDLASGLAWVHRFPEAEAVLPEIFELRESLVRDFPDEAEGHVGLANVYALKGNILVTQRDRAAEAETAYREAVTRLSKLREQHPRNVQVRRLLVLALDNLGFVLGTVGRLDEAEEVERRALGLQEDLATDYPEYPEYQDGLALSLANLAAVVRGQGWGEESEVLYRRALAVRERIAADHPRFAANGYYHRVVLSSLAYTLKTLGKNEEARRLLERAIRLSRDALRAQPDATNASKLRDEAMLLAEVLVELDDHGAAARVMQEIRWDDLFSGELPASLEYQGRAVEVWDRLVAKYPDRPEYRQQLARSLGVLSAALLNLGREAEAAEPTIRARDILKKLVANHPDVPEYRRDLVEHVARMYRVADWVSTDPAKAKEDHERAFDLARTAAELRPQDEMALQSLGAAQYRAGDWKGSVETLMKSMRSDPTKGDSFQWFFLAMDHRQLGDSVEARRWFDRADQHFRWYEEHWRPGTHPEPAMLRRIRDEAATLLGISSIAEGQPVGPTTEPRKP